MTEPVPSEEALERALGVRTPCRPCQGRGHVELVRSVYVCCGRRSEDGECCEEPVEEVEYDGQECASCMGTGEVTGAAE